MAKEYKRAPYSEFEQALRVTGLSETQMCEMLGYSPGAYSGWKTNDEIPFVAGVALRTIVAEHLKVAMIYAQASDMDTIKKFVNGVGGTFRSVRI